MLENILANPDQITFTVLFVMLLVYVMRTNENREKQYRETIDRLTERLEVVKDIEAQVNKVANFIYTNTKDNKD